MRPHSCGDSPCCPDQQEQTQWRGCGVTTDENVFPLQGLTFQYRIHIPHVLVADSREFLHHLDLPRKLL